MIVSDHFVLCKAALIFALTRWLLSFAFNILNTKGLFARFSNSSTPQGLSCSSSCQSSTKMKRVTDSLCFNTFDKIQHRLLDDKCNMSCAVCLNRFKKKTQIYELVNCCHVFHKHCLESWVCYDTRSTCPLCRASLLPVSNLPARTQQQQPSWAVEHMLYFFGDDLLP